MKQYLTKNRSLFALFLTLNVLGFCIALQLTKHHFSFLAGRNTQKAFCNVSALVNCDAVTASAFSELGGFAVSSWATGYYALLFFIALFLAASLTGRKPASSGAKIGIAGFYAVTSFELVHSVLLFFIALKWIKAICLLCTFLYVINLILWLCSRYFARQVWADSTLMSSFSQLLPYNWHRKAVVTLLVTALLTFGGALMADAKMRQSALKGQENRMAEILSRFREQSPFGVEIGSSPTYGPSAAPVTLVEFSDFACPFCRKATSVAKAVLRRYEGQYRLAFKNFPLDSECNPRLNRSLHPGACMMARAALCADDQGKFWQLHDRLFDLEEAADRDAIVAAALALGLNAEKFKTCLDSSATQERLKNDIEDAYRLGINGTPVFFFNGRPVEGFMTAPIFGEVFETALALVNK